MTTRAPKDNAHLVTCVTPRTQERNAEPEVPQAPRRRGPVALQAVDLDGVLPVPERDQRHADRRGVGRLPAPVPARMPMRPAPTQHPVSVATLWLTIARGELSWHTTKNATTVWPRPRRHQGGRTHVRGRKGPSADSTSSPDEDGLLLSLRMTRVGWRRCWPLPAPYHAKRLDP